MLLDTADDAQSPPFTFGYADGAVGWKLTLVADVNSFVGTGDLEILIHVNGITVKYS